MPLNPNASTFNPSAPTFVPTVATVQNSTDPALPGSTSFPALGAASQSPQGAPPAARGAWRPGAARGAWGAGPPAVAAAEAGKEADKTPSVAAPTPVAQTVAARDEPDQKADGTVDGVAVVDADLRAAATDTGTGGNTEAKDGVAGDKVVSTCNDLGAAEATAESQHGASETKQAAPAVTAAAIEPQASASRNELAEQPVVSSSGDAQCAATDDAGKGAEGSGDAEGAAVQWHQALQPPPPVQRAASSKDGTAVRLQHSVAAQKQAVAAPGKPVDAAILRWKSVEDLHAAAAMNVRSEPTFEAMPSVVTWMPGVSRKRRQAASPAKGGLLSLEIPEYGVVQDPKLEDFQLLRMVGRGGFGKVYQVRKKRSGRIMALKAMRKHLIVEELNVEGTHNERSVLESVQHPFIIRLHCAFHDHGRLYLLMDWHNGGHLLKLLHEHAPFMEKEVRFYMAELVLAIEGLHEQGIVHRDLKPENVLLDSMGHLVVTDFGASKISAKEEEDIRTNSWVGTELYMAPEQLQGKVYGRVVDWWAVGLLCWEMLTGDNPFYHENPDQVAARVQKKKLNLPSHLHGDTHSILKAMLNRDPEKRLGKGGTAEVKDHAFFAKAKGFSWKDAYEKKHPPPFHVPGLQENPDDVSQVDDVYTSLPAVMSPIDPGTALSPGAQEQFKGFEWVSPDTKWADHRLYSPAVSRMPVPDLQPSHLDLGAPPDAIQEESSGAVETDAAPPPSGNAWGNPARSVNLVEGSPAEDPPTSNARAGEPPECRPPDGSSPAVSSSEAARHEAAAPAAPPRAADAAAEGARSTATDGSGVLGDQGAVPAEPPVAAPQPAAQPTNAWGRPLKLGAPSL